MPGGVGGEGPRGLSLSRLAGQIQVIAAIVNEQLWVLSQSRLPSRARPAVALLLYIVDEFLREKVIKKY
jgi:hypothetical protein